MIELLYSVNCPNFEPTLSLLREIIKESHSNAAITVTEVTSHADAIFHRFLGSPSIRINDRDIEGAESPLAEYSLRCRRYREDGRAVGVPPRALIEEALRSYFTKGHPE